MFKRFLLSLIRFYQKTWFARVPVFGEGICRFTPTCSEYTYQAIKKYGILRGSLLGLRRVLRCHPWSKGGVDKVPKFQFPSTKSQINHKHQALNSKQFGN